MRTYGYIRDSILAKLDLEQSEADNLNYMNRIPTFANEAMTQICSTVKPKKEYATFEVWDKRCKLDIWNYLRDKYNVYPNENTPIELKVPTTSDEASFWSAWLNYHFVDELIEVGIKITVAVADIKKDINFVSFNDDVPTVQKIICTKDWYITDSSVPFEAHDSDFEYKGYNKIFCKHPGIYTIPYDSRWVDFTDSAFTTDEDATIEAPDDVIDCIPSYVVSQLFKIDDEYKASVYRNEYEMFLARIDNTDYRNSKTIEIGGDW